jgi:hypothetical protein
MQGNKNFKPGEIFGIELATPAIQNVKEART